MGWKKKTAATGRRRGPHRAETSSSHDGKLTADRPPEEQRKKPRSPQQEDLAQGLDDAFQKLAVGHEPPKHLTPQDEELFRAFQSNLLSLISHELRTPLTGILNSLSMLESGEMPEFAAAEMIAMARRNAQRLNAALSSLLDLAALESGAFHARLREVNFPRLVQGRLDALAALLKDREQTLDLITGQTDAPVLADPQKLGRAIELCTQLVVPRAPVGAVIQVRISSATIQFSFELAEEAVGGDPVAEWQQAWSQALIGFEGGVASPASAFAGTVQSEKDFLTRTREGLGSEFLLIHEIVRLHHGMFAQETEGNRVTLSLELPELSSEEALRTVLGSRVYQTSTGLSSVALALIKVPADEGIQDFRDRIRNHLFRATDAVYSLPARRQLALVMDDCKPEDGPRLITRIAKGVGRQLSYGVATCPDEAADPELLIRMAEKRLK